MMYVLRRMAIPATALLTAFFLTAPASAQDRQAMVRVAHLSPDTTAVDVRVDGEPVGDLTGLPFEMVSPYRPLSAGTHNITIYASGDTSAPLFGADVDLREDGAYTVGVVGLVADGSLTSQVYEDDISPPAQGKTKLRVVHAVPDVAEVDISSSEGASLFTDLGFPNATKYVEVPAGTYTFEAKPAGEETVAFTIPNGTFSPGAVYSAFVIGQAASGKVEVLVAEYAGSPANKQDTALLPVLARPETIPVRSTSSIPLTGGIISPGLLALLAASVVVFLTLSATKLRRGT